MPAIPNSFSAGAVAQSSQVNANFQAMANAILPTFVFTIPGALFTGTNLTLALISNGSWTITKVYAYVKTAPVGANIILDIKKNGVSIWNVTTADRVHILDSTNLGTQTAFDVASLADEDILTLDVTQIGSTTAGSDLTVEIKVN